MMMVELSYILRQILVSQDVRSGVSSFVILELGAERGDR